MIVNTEKKITRLAAGLLLEYPLEPSGKQSSPEMVCCAIECNNMKIRWMSIVLNAVYGCNGPQACLQMQQ